MAAPSTGIPRTFIPSPSAPAYLTITESKRRTERDGSFTFDKHKIFLYKEDFDKFAEGLAEVVDYIRNTCLKGVEKGEQQPQKEDF